MAPGENGSPEIWMLDATMREVDRLQPKSTAWDVAIRYRSVWYIIVHFVPSAELFLHMSMLSLVLVHAGNGFAFLS